VVEVHFRFAGQRLVRPVHGVVRPARVRGTGHRTGRALLGGRPVAAAVVVVVVVLSVVPAAPAVLGRRARRRQIDRAQGQHRVAPLGRPRRLVPQAQPATAPVHSRHHTANAYQQRYYEGRNQCDRRPRAPRLVLDVTFTPRHHITLIF